MMSLDELRPGNHISYDYIVGINDLCTGQGEVVEITGTVFQSSRGPRCFECAVNNTPSPIAAPIGVEVPQYELDDEPVDDIPGPVMVEKEFDRKAFVIEMIESVMELSQLRNAPAEITLELIDAVLVVA